MTLPSKVAILTSALAGLLGLDSPIRAATPADVFDQVWQTVRDHFHDPALRGVDWSAAHESFGREAGAARSSDDFATVVNRMLATLRTSHTRLYTRDMPEYHQLAGIFWPFLEAELKPFLPDGTPHYSGIGLGVMTSGNATFVRAVFDGLPAEVAGVRVGDRLLEVDGRPFHPMRSFAGKVGQSIRVRLQRTADPASAQSIAVTPVRLDPQVMFLDAMKASVEIIARESVRIGYVHLWSYAGERYQQQLEAELNGRLREVDALILDLREGWGGASPKYLWPFLAPPLTHTAIARDGTRSDHPITWTKPVCLLVNERTTSGKEVLAYYFQKVRRGPIVGSRTAGAVMAGRPFVMGDGSILYVAVADGLTDGLRLEGRGVLPDVEVPFILEYAAGHDAPKERAIAELIKSMR